MKSIDDAKAALGEQFSFFSDLIQERVAALALPSGARVLDIGTGGGRAAITLALMGYQVVTGEPADDSTAYAKQPWRADAREVGADDAITFEPFDASALPFDDGAFDAVVMMGALHHMEQPAAAVAECLRVLAPNGALCVMEPTAALVAQARAKHPDHPDPMDPTPLAGGRSVHKHSGEMFDSYVIRGGASSHASHAR